MTYLPGCSAMQLGRELQRIMFWECSQSVTLPPCKTGVSLLFTIIVLILNYHK